jgi:hypothetical protein
MGDLLLYCAAVPRPNTPYQDLSTEALTSSGGACVLLALDAAR